MAAPEKRRSRGGTLLEELAQARDNRHEAEDRFLAALRTARRVYSWAELAQVAQLPKSTVRYLCLDMDERRRWNNHHRKEQP